MQVCAWKDMQNRQLFKYAKKFKNGKKRSIRKLYTKFTNMHMFENLATFSFIYFADAELSRGPR